MGLGKLAKGFFTSEEEEDQLELTKEEAETLSQYEAPQIKGGAKSMQDAGIALFEPRAFEEAQQIADHIKAKRACAINLHRMPAEYRQRIIDFLTGVIYALDGTIHRLGDNVILCSPKSIPVGGEITFNE